VLACGILRSERMLKSLVVTGAEEISLKKKAPILLTSMENKMKRFVLIVIIVLK
jgi:hypothetical protein